MTTLRNLHFAGRLGDGRVFVAGGYNGGGALASAELYDPWTGLWTPTNSMSMPRSLAIATLLQDGRVLMAGGVQQFIIGTLTAVFTSSAEIFDPAAGAWTTTRGAMGTPRGGATATLLGDGRVLVAGGQNNATNAILDTAEIFDPATGLWRDTTGKMTAARVSHSATLLRDGTVLIAGGTNPTDLATSELYDPKSDSFSTTASLNLSAPRSGHAAVGLGDGNVLVVGGDNGVIIGTAEVYDWVARAWEPPTSTVSLRFNSSTTLLADGDVLAAGGEIGNTDAIDAIASAERFHP
jgi:hypothetical protein